MSSSGAQAKRIVKRIAAGAGRSPEPGWSDRKLVRGCLRHDEAAWNALVDKYKNLVYAIVLRYGIDGSDAGDVFQATWVDVLKDLDQLRDRDNIRSWLAKVALNKCYHWQQRRRIESTRSDQLTDQEPAPDQATPELWLEELQQQQGVRECLEALSPRCSRLVHMLFYEDPPRPYADVASSLGLATGSIGFIRRRCLERLQELLEEEGLH